MIIEEGGDKTETQVIDLDAELSTYSHYTFSPDEIIGLRSFFNQRDMDSDGRLGKDEFKCFLQSTHMDTRFIEAIFQIFDRNKDGFLTFDDFLAFLDACIISEKHPAYFYKLIFDCVDTDHNGFINLEEMIGFTELCGKKLSPNQIRDELRSIDKDKSDTIDFNEVCLALKII
ncbi:EF hand family protein [Trichomonas vaginalis G3]|uniref:EF hand family protein n=1 Tax=Trichomonas vaginalis (strain ATCC PRA-98 / G3) TaxID=412133 RepID=A2EF97_TRIV3|nr:EF-hand family [Trichomonas vaginalis G3]EAY08707.1 EF hand family protein [Trichomonas vaginalis G3]KAI5492834.1 EF-hand family [Trichomonas vaginalis G3]|eukprot:XP_001320930.1 EF hand family protein [Trichomonas vaginalis G3]